MARRTILVARPLRQFSGPILILATWAMLAGAGGAQAPVGTGTGYMRAISASGHVIAGESTDPVYNAWVPLRQTTMPTAEQIAEETATQGAGSAAKVVHPPIVVLKDRDMSSLALLGAYTSHQHFPEIDITLTDHSDQPAKKYKLTDAMIVSLRASVMPDGSQQAVEQLRITYAKIEILP
jgi:type VI protein secretion system component Hcp